jgi:hypothetical protein
VTTALSLHPDLVATIQCVDDKHIDLVKYAAEGALAGGLRALSRGLTFPLDTIKTWTQSSNIDDDEDDVDDVDVIKENDSGLINLEEDEEIDEGEEDEDGKGRKSYPEINKYFKDNLR